MGLDMYLYRTKKVHHFSADDYYEVEMFVDEYVTSEHQLIDLEKSLGLKDANQLRSCIKQHDRHPGLYSIFEEVGYWRKANMIHKWFVENVQDGKDDCYFHMVSKDQTKTLYRLVQKVLNKEVKPDQSLPTQRGFFFGSMDYDDINYHHLRRTKEILEKVILETDFDKEVLIYESSW